jgi:hypothetical protein
MRFYPTVRPYWHVDAKWVCGLLLIFSLAITLFLFALVKLTDEKNGPTIAALAVGAAFIRGDSAVDIEEAKAELAKQGGQIRPVPNFPDIVITEADLNLTPTEIKLKVFKPITEEIYQNGIEATAERHATTPEQKEQFINDAFFFKLFTKDTNRSLSSKLTIFIVISLILLAGVVYFSTGWGRLANPGLILLFVSLPGSLFSLALTHPPKDGDGGGLGFLPADLTKELGGSLSGVYTRIFLLGLALLIGAGIGKLITHFRPPKTTKPAAKKTPA